MIAVISTINGSKLTGFAYKGQRLKQTNLSGYY